MEDLVNLGSLLPAGYTAPEVSSALGGELWGGVCNGGTGTTGGSCIDEGSITKGGSCIDTGFGT